MVKPTTPCLQQGHLNSFFNRLAVSRENFKTPCTFKSIFKNSSAEAMLCTQGTYEVVHPKHAHEYLLMLNTIADSSPWVNKEGCWKRLFRTTYDCICFQTSIATTETVLRKPWGDDYLGALLLEHKLPTGSLGPTQVTPTSSMDTEAPHWSPCSFPQMLHPWAANGLTKSHLIILIPS